MESKRLTIIVDDNAVYRDQGTYLGLDLSSANIPDTIHALQWHENAGEIEYKRQTMLSNEPITELPQWALDCIQIWEQAHQAAQQ